MTIMKFNFVLMQVIFGREQLFKNAGVILLHEQGIVLVGLRLNPYPRILEKNPKVGK